MDGNILMSVRVCLLIKNMFAFVVTCLGLNYIHIFHYFSCLSSIELWVLVSINECLHFFW